MAERAVERHFCTLVERYGGKTRKLDNLRDDPDRLVLLPGARVFFAELKQPGKRPRPSQLRRHAELRAMGFDVLVLDGTDWTQLLTKLRDSV